MLQNESEIHSILDPRTKILLVISIATIMIGGSNLGVFGWAKYILAAVPFLLYLMEKRFKPAFLYISVYILASLLEVYVVKDTYGILNFFLVAFTMVITMMLPGFVMAGYLMTTTTVAGFMASMKKLHVPDALTIPLAVTFRLFPTIAEEYRSIQSAMKIRGVRFGGGKPFQIVEYRIIPLLMSMMKIAENLSAAALTRGLGSPNKRTSIVKLHFTWMDGISIVLCILSWGLFLFDLIGRAIH